MLTIILSVKKCCLNPVLHVSYSVSENDLLFDHVSSIQKNIENFTEDIVHE